MPKKKKKWPLIAAVAAGAGILAVWGISSATNAIRSLRPSACQVAEVASETIDTTVVGTGTLTYADQLQVMLPDGVEVTSVFLENGQTVQEGEMLASVDTSALELLMSETYQEIADVESQMRTTPSEPELTVITAPAAGTVMTISAANGASVLETLASSGSLMLISPDGRMEAEIETDDLPEVGSQVTLVFPDGKERAAEVENVREGSFTAVLTDRTLPADTTVGARKSDGRVLGSGRLMPVDAISVVGPAGKVEGITVSVGAEVKTGQDLFSVRASYPPAAYQKLESQRRALTAKYDALAQLQQAGGLVAPVSGTITACNITEGSTAAASSLTDAMNGMPASAQGILSAFGMGRNTVHGSEKTTLLGLQAGGENMLLESAADPEPPPQTTSDTPAEPSDEPQPAPPASDEPTQPAPAQTPPTQVPDTPRVIPRLSVPLIPPIPNLPLQHEIDLLPLYTAEITWDPADEQAQYDTKYTAHVILQALDGFLFADDCSVTVVNGDVTGLSVTSGGGSLTFDVGYEPTMKPITLPDIDWDAIQGFLDSGVLDLNSLAALLSSGLLPGDALNFDISSLLGGANLSSVLGGADFSSILGGGADLSALAGMSPEALMDAYGTANLEDILAAGAQQSSANSYEVEAYTIAPDNTMQLSIQINQMDILSVTPGMPCTITVDALENDSFDGTVADIRAGEAGSNSYTAQITFTKTADMLSGMSASAVITTSETDSPMTLPAAAIQEDGRRVFVYTSFDPATDEFGGEKDIETGVSNGTDVEILSGVEPGEKVYYPALSPMEQMAQMFGPQDAEDRAEISVSERDQQGG